MADGSASPKLALRDGSVSSGCPLADRSRAAELDRSRSRVVVDALRRYVSEPAESVGAVREPPATYGAGLGPGRLAQLEADLALTPEERVLLAHQTAVIGAGRRRGAPLRHRVVVFDRIVDFFVWERREAIDL